MMLDMLVASIIDSCRVYMWHKLDDRAMMLTVIVDYK